MALSTAEFQAVAASRHTRPQWKLPQPPWWFRLFFRLSVIILVVTALVVGLVTATGQRVVTQGQQVAYMANRYGNDDLMLLDTERSLSYSLTHTGINERFPAWSPDGTRIAFHSDEYSSPLQHRWDIFVMDADGSNMERLTFDGANNAMAAWSPDGSTILYHSEYNNNWDIYSISVAGGERQLLVGNADENTVSNEVMPALSPDGTQLAFISDRDGDRELFIMDMATRDLRQVTYNDDKEWGPVWSPDGTQLVFESNRSGNWDLYLLTIATNRIRRLTNRIDDEFGASWTADGTQLVYEAWSGSNFDLYAMNPDGSNKHTLTYNTINDSAPVWRP